MAGAFQESAFQFTGFQMDPVTATPPVGGVFARYGFAKIFEDDDPRPKIERILVERVRTKPDRPGRLAPRIEIPLVEVAEALIAEAQSRKREDIALIARLIMDRLDEEDLEVLLLS